ncbi:MAG: hypothetical protein HY690_15395 [Chloroflexi bacterium]|nr:hypothetical protein [Chloroflexota bacterium]
MQEDSEYATPSTVADLPGFPFGSFSELQAALQTRAASLSPRQDIARTYAGSVAANFSAFERTFFTVFMLCWLWGGAIMVALGWGTLGTSSLALMVVAFASFIINRPWTTPIITFIAVAATAWGAFGGQPFLAWTGGTWLLVWFLSNGWQNWCTDRFKDRLAVDEPFFVASYLSRWVAVVLKGGERLMAERTQEDIERTARIAESLRRRSGSDS